MKKHTITEIRHITDSAFVVRLERDGFNFQSGQFVLLGLDGSSLRREYSVYSGEKDEYIEVLIREIMGGKVSKQIKKCQPGDKLELDGPYGFFKFHPDKFPAKKFLFIATGTGVSPFHSFVRTFPGLDYQLIHGVRHGNEDYGHNDFQNERITMCTSGENTGNFYGRVTDYLYGQKIDHDTQCFLCGNSEMIDEVFDMLIGKGIPVSNIFSEVYF